MTTNQPPEGLRQAIEHLRAGRAEAARPLLIDYVRANPNSDQGWYFLSLAVADPKQQIECLQRALKINPANEQARARFIKLTQPPPPGASLQPPATPPPITPFVTKPPATPTQPASPATSAPRQTGAPPKPLKRKAAQPLPAQVKQAIIMLGAVFAITALFIIVYFGVRGYQARVAATQQKATVQMVIALATAGLPTLPPTWTVTPTPTITSTPTITPTPTATSTPTLPAPETEVLAEMDKIQQEVADLRGLAIKSPVSSFVIGNRKVRDVLTTLYLTNGGSEEVVNDEAHTLSALGLIKPTYDLFTNTLNGISDGLGGFYVPWTEQLFVIGARFSGVEKFVFSHEYAHALVDQHYDFNAMQVMPVCGGDEQRCDAIRALIEGDATLVMYQWVEQYAGPQDYVEILSYVPPRGALPEQFPPPYAVQNSNFPYTYGYDFVKHFYERGNWAEVNKIYLSLPQSTEQILHPEKYTAGEQPVFVTPQPLAETLGSGWRLLKSNSLGEWMTYLLLGYGADGAAQVDDQTAKEAAEGWGGDNYQMYYNDATRETVMAVHWAWDSQADADEFWEAMLFYQDERFRGAKVNRSDGQCWEANNQASCVFKKGQEMLWLLAPNQTILNNILAQHPNFP
jgi:hypothetical protein